MARLPFPFNAEEFHPLQPEDSEMERVRREDDRYAHMYRYVSVERYTELEVGDVLQRASRPVVNDYRAWQEVCRSMDEETEQARREWREACIHRDREIARLRAHCEELRAQVKMLELRPKPPQPRSNRR